MTTREKNLPSHRVSECGHVTKEVGPDRTIVWDKCRVLTSKKVKLPNGQSVYICPTHIKEYER